MKINIGMNVINVYLINVNIVENGYETSFKNIKRRY
jgi:hypothetical protein